MFKNKQTEIHLTHNLQSFPFGSAKCVCVVVCVCVCVCGGGGGVSSVRETIDYLGGTKFY